MKMTKPKGKRKVDNCPNRLFMSFIQKWRDDAAEKGLKCHQTYNRALNSLQKYPLPLQCGKEASVLEFFGDKICSMLDKQLQKEADAADVTPREYLEQSRSVSTNWWDYIEEGSNQKQASKPKRVKKTAKAGGKSRPYVPIKNSGPYALILVLYENSIQRCDSTASMRKEALIESAQQHCNSSFTVPQTAGSFFTAWSSMSTLTAKGLVIKESHPALYRLTDEGFALGNRLKSVNENRGVAEGNCVDRRHDNHSNTASSFERVQVHNEIVSHDVLSDDSDSSPSVATDSRVAQSQFVLEPGTFEIVLCVDVRETSGSDGRKSYLKSELQKTGVPCVERQLNVGDFAWIARSRLNSSRSRELVLDHVIERKCISDLACSIRDGRFREQKMRLKQCGARHVIYLIENMREVGHQSLPERTLRQALHNARVVDGFFVKLTDSIHATGKYLQTITEHLSGLYAGKRLCATASGSQTRVKRWEDEVHFLHTFADFNNESAKGRGLSVSEVFVRQLMQISGMSFDKGQAIADSYPGPARLLDAYRACASDEQRMTLLANLKWGPLRKNVGKNLSAAVARVFTA